MTAWALWQFTRADASGAAAEQPDAELVHLRDVPSDEVERVRAALQVAGEMNGQHLIGPFIGSANRVRAVIEHIREQPGARSMDIEVQLELDMALDEWLGSTHLFRKRTVRKVRRCLGDAAGEGAKRQLRSCITTTLTSSWCGNGETLRSTTSTRCRSRGSSEVVPLRRRLVGFSMVGEPSHSDFGGPSPSWRT